MLRRSIVAAVFLFSSIVVAEQSSVAEISAEPSAELSAASSNENPALPNLNDQPAKDSEKNTAVSNKKSSSISSLKSASSVTVPATSGAGIGSGVVAANPLSVVLGLLVVLALIFFVAWLMRRVGGMQMLAGQSMKVVSALSVGSREKVLLINVGDKQLLIGVAPGRVSKLHYFDEPVVLPSRSNSNDFSSTIKKVLQQNNQAATTQTGSK